MKEFFSSFLIAFSMYSKIPVPQVEWNKSTMKYVMGCFPWVGAVIGLLFALWGSYGKLLPIGTTLYTVIWLLIPVAVTGGIHMDGFLDTWDAISSYQPRERRLEILKDSHAGAFAVISCVVYVLCYFGFLSELSEGYVIVVSLGFFYSRALSGLAVTCFPCAKDSGLAAAFAENGSRRANTMLLAGELIFCAIVMVAVNPLAGGVQLLAAMLCFWYYHHMALEKFGGITGDLAGWFLQTCELCMLIGVVLVQTAEKLL